MIVRLVRSAREFATDLLQFAASIGPVANEPWAVVSPVRREDEQGPPWEILHRCKTPEQAASLADLYGQKTMTYPHVNVMDYNDVIYENREWMQGRYLP